MAKFKLDTYKKIVPNEIFARRAGNTKFNGVSMASLSLVRVTKFRASLPEETFSLILQYLPEDHSYDSNWGTMAIKKVIPPGTIKSIEDRDPLSLYHLKRHCEYQEAGDANYYLNFSNTRVPAKMFNEFRDRLISNPQTYNEFLGSGELPSWSVQMNLEKAVNASRFEIAAKMNEVAARYNSDYRGKEIMEHIPIVYNLLKSSSINSSLEEDLSLSGFGAALRVLEDLSLCNIYRSLYNSRN